MSLLSSFTTVRVSFVITHLASGGRLDGDEAESHPTSYEDSRHPPHTRPHSENHHRSYRPQLLLSINLARKNLARSL